ncbi:MAG: hypothetical protein IKN29_03505 [Bacteroidales bacterium]|nr:hypothetical protein [Bacteroidales bacterium]
MKKLMLSAIAFAAMMCATAQNPITPVSMPDTNFKVSTYYAIPRFFSYNNNVYLPVEHRINGDLDTLFYYNTNFQLVKKFSWGSGLATIYFCDYDVDFLGEGACRILATQTLFNNDENFEYVVGVKNEEGRMTAYQVVSDNGTVLHTFPFDFPSNYDYSISMIKVEGVLYFNIYYSDYGEIRRYKTDWYRFDRQTQSIARVENVPFNVFPTVAERGSDITVQLEEGTNAREIVVIDAMGREVKSVPVAQGQREVKINTSDLGHGMGFVSDRKNGAVKIIVR